MYFNNTKHTGLNDCLLVFLLIAEGRRSPRAPTISIVVCPSPIVNTLPLLDIICPSSPRPASSSLSIRSSFQYVGAQVSSSDHMAKVLEFALRRCIQLSPGVPVVVLLAALMHWSDVPSSLPWAIFDMLSSQNLVFVFCPQPSVSTLHTHIVPLSTLMLTEVFVKAMHSDDLSLIHI